MQFFTSFIPLNAIASLLAVLAACAFGGANELAPSAATDVPVCAVAADNGCLPDVDRGTAPEFSQHVVRATCLAVARASEASGPTIAQPKRTLSIDKLCDFKARDVCIAGWDTAVAAGKDRQTLDPCSLIELHIRLQV
jgi:hypothetical protein